MFKGHVFCHSNVNAVKTLMHQSPMVLALDTMVVEYNTQACVRCKAN